MRVLLSEGSGLTSRQTAWILGELGHEVELMSSSRLCLSRFTRHVRAVHPAPNFGADPFGWLAATVAVARARKVDLLLPTQEQVTVLSAQRERLGVATVVPPFAALRAVQDKISACRTLARIGLAQPATVELASREDLGRVERFPVFVKRPVSTASAGVRRATSAAELAEAARALGPFPLIAQAAVDGPLAMAQAVADRGRLIAHHANLRVAEGIGGGAAIKRSVVVPGLAEMLRHLTAALDWHGGLALDVILSAAGPVVIDVNPRLVEPANAWASGVDLVGAMLELAGGGAARERPAGRANVVTHQALLAILGAAERTGSRIAVGREAADLGFRRGAYAGSREELTPVAGDPLAAAPVLAAFAATILRPSLWRLFHRGAVGAYALTPRAWEEIVASAG